MTPYLDWSSSHSGWVSAYQGAPSWLTSPHHYGRTNETGSGSHKATWIRTLTTPTLLCHAFVCIHICKTNSEASEVSDIEFLAVKTPLIQQEHGHV